MRAAVLLLLLSLRLALAANAEAWKSQIIYFLITDRFSQAPGTTPGGKCDMTGWNNGTWSGITANLNYIKDLGMTAIWITPIPYQTRGSFYGSSAYHGYWAQDWTRLEPNYGTEQDLLDLVHTAKAKGMMTMLDVVGNHVGPVGFEYSSIVPFNKPEHYHACTDGCDEFCNIPQSAYNAVQPNVTLIHTCRLQGLPDLNQTNPYVRQQLIGWVKGILQKYEFDGLRLDTVKHVDLGFWREYSAAAGRFTMGEVYNGDSHALLEFVQGPNPPMDSVLNFPMYYILNNVFAHQQDMRQLAAEREKQYDALGRQIVSTMGTFIDNHDVPRFLAIQPDQQLLKNALAWMLMAEGIPVIFYGTASGFKGSTETGLNRGCLWEHGYVEDDDLYQTTSKLAKFRTHRQLWVQPEEVLAATEDCFIFTRGPNVLVVTTNVGNRSSSAEGHSCSLVLPRSSTLMNNGVSGIQDVLARVQGAKADLVWYPGTRRLTIPMPLGAPRVLTTTTVSEGSNSTGTTSSSSTKVASNKMLKQGVSEPQTGSSHSSKDNVGAVTGALFAAALAVFVAALLQG